MSEGRRSDRAADGRDLFGLLAFMLALALILHQLWWYGFEARHPFVLAAALWVLLRPTSVPRLLLMLAAAVAGVAVDMPDVGDHVLLIGLCGAGILASVAAASLSERRLPAAGELFERIAPFLRAAVIVLYTAVALSKLNTTFLDPQLSCAAAMSARITWFDPGLLGPWRIEPAIWGTLTVEAALPLLLVLRRTRAAGLVLGVGFHVVLALAGNVPFSTLMLALYVAFLPADLPTRVRALFAAGRGRAAIALAERPRPRWLEPAAFAALVACWLAGGLMVDADPGLADALIENGTRLAIVAIAAAAATIALRLRRHRPLPAACPAAGSLRTLHPALLVAIGLLVLNGLSPYIGLKTETTFSMFSDLHTEPGHWNHALIPEAVRIFPLQDDLVRVVATDDPILQRSIDDDQMVVRTELNRYRRQHPTAHASVEGANGDPVTVAPAATGSGPELGGIPAQVLLDRLGKFKPVPASGEGGC